MTLSIGHLREEIAIDRRYRDETDSNPVIVEIDSIDGSNVNIIATEARMVGGRLVLRASLDAQNEQDFKHIFTMSGNPRTAGGKLWAGKPHPRHGQKCRFILKSKNGNTLIEFADGERMITTIFNVRKFKG